MNYFKCLIPLFTLVSVILANHCTKNHCACCQNDSCGNHADPFCVGCLPGYTGKYCDIRCPNNCKKCDQLDNGTTCFECLDGFYDQEGDCSKRCRPECKTCVSKDQCTSCRDGFFKNETAEDCRYQCTERCASCWSRDDCKLCYPGFYGKTCEKTCGGGCRERACDMITGFCICEKQQVCKRCVSGTFGNTCEQTCPVNCIECTSELSCDDCRFGYYGTTCELRCSNGCLLGECTKIDGACKKGCHEFFTGMKCDTCKVGRHGYMCSSYCPRNCYSCINETSCNACSLGYFGDVCQCSDQVLSDACKHKEIWSEGIIVPILKGGNKNDPGNYREIEETKNDKVDAYIGLTILGAIVLVIVAVVANNILQKYCTKCTKREGIKHNQAEMMKYNIPLMEGHRERTASTETEISDTNNA